MEVAIAVVAILAFIGIVVVLQKVGAPQRCHYEGGWYRPLSPYESSRLLEAVQRGEFCSCKGTGRIDIGGGRELWCRRHPRR